LDDSQISWDVIQNGERWRFVMAVALRADFKASQLFEEFRITIAKQTHSRELRAMGYRKLSARPRHCAQAEGVIEDLKKLLSAPG
jgi:hypothetical protein